MMVDTYNYKIGLKKYIKKIKGYPKETQKKLVISIDSGDMYQQAMYFRKHLDAAKLYDVRINGYSNLEEYKIDKLVKRKAPIDWYVACTEILNITDNPKLELVFKLAEVRENQKIIYKAKLTKGKESLPGRKQIFRIYDKNGKIKEDIIGLENEKLSGKKLLIQFMKNGEIIKKTGDLEQVKKDLEEELKTLPDYSKDIYSKKIVPVIKSKKIEEILLNLRKKHQ